ncbi:hypothetical protein ACLB2K_050575 [Fragaria x ananassa]
MFLRWLEPIRNLMLFDNEGKIRVHVSHDITRPFILKKLIKFDEGLEAEVSFYYENLVGLCKKCMLISHPMGNCPAAPKPTGNPSSWTEPRCSSVRFWQSDCKWPVHFQRESTPTSTNQACRLSY